MKSVKLFLALMAVGLLAAGAALAEKSQEQLIAEAESAGPKAVTKGATTETHDGKLLREGTNGWVCYAGSAAIGPMCNQTQ